MGEGASQREREESCITEGIIDFECIRAAAAEVARERAACLIWLFVYSVMLIERWSQFTNFIIFFFNFILI